MCIRDSDSTDTLQNEFVQTLQLHHFAIEQLHQFFDATVIGVIGKSPGMGEIALEIEQNPVLTFTCYVVQQVTKAPQRIEAIA